MPKPTYPEGYSEWRAEHPDLSPREVGFELGILSSHVRRWDAGLEQEPNGEPNNDEPNNDEPNNEGVDVMTDAQNQQDESQVDGSQSTEEMPEPTLDERIRAAEQAGEWDKAGRLKLQRHYGHETPQESPEEPAEPLSDEELGAKVEELQKAGRDAEAFALKAQRAMGRMMDSHEVY